MRGQLLGLSKATGLQALSIATFHHASEDYDTSKHSWDREGALLGRWLCCDDRLSTMLGGAAAAASSISPCLAWCGRLGKCSSVSLLFSVYM